MALISQDLPFYQSLVSGSRHPKTPEQQRIIEVRKGRRQARTPHEIALVKYRIQSALRRRSVAQDSPDHSDLPDDVADEQWHPVGRNWRLDPYKANESRSTGPRAGSSERDANWSQDG